jgi:hypothetical protein
VNLKIESTNNLLFFCAKANINAGLTHKEPPQKRKKNAIAAAKGNSAFYNSL